MVPALLACAFAFVWLCAYWSNSDLFSPIKLYLLTLFICFFDIFVNRYSLEIDCIYVGLLAVPLVIIVSEARARGPFNALMREHTITPVTRPLSSEHTVAIIWLLTIVPVASMAYLVSLFGGLTNYLSQLASRALALQGLNPFSEVAINLISLLTVLYFGIGVIRKHSTFWWLAYGMHFMIAVTILSFSGSRRYFLIPLIMMLSLYHYYRAAVSIKRACVCLLCVLVVTSVIGVVRMGQRGVDVFSRDLNDVERESVTAHFKYGLVPLEVVFNADILNLRYGSTFVAAVTNLIPRSWWPEKPDSAGLVITKDYLGDRWLGASNLNAGLFAESIMNFGFPIGLVVSFGGVFFAMAFLVRRYRRVLLYLRHSGRSLESIFYLVRYLQIAVAITGLITWETAIVTMPLILNLTALSIIERLLRSIKPSPLAVDSGWNAN